MTRIVRTVLAAHLLAFASACDSSPTIDPVALSVTGTWSGVLPIRTPSGSWSEPAELTLTHSADVVTGELVTSDGVRFAVAGTAMRDGNRDAMSISLLGLPGTSTCAGVLLTADRFWFSGGRPTRMAGRASGRCFGTIAGAFTVERVR